MTITSTTTATAGRPCRRRRDREIPLTELALILAGETLAPEGTCQAFALHPDGRAVITDSTGRRHSLRPSGDGLYDIAALGLHP